MYSSTPDPSQSRSADSWIEISSRPSNSALSSAAPDDIVTTGLRVQHSPNTTSPGRQTPRSPLSHHHLDNDGPPSAGGGSSQDEYEESESESDRVMTSSNEGLPHSAASATAESPIFDEEDDDGDGRNATAFDVLTEQQCFTPQPNAFTHPPSSSSRHRASVPGSYFPAIRPAPSSQRHSFPGNQQRQAHSPYSAVSPHHQADHDAALRASLTTLLSCAAAARSLPKKSHDGTTATASRASQGLTSARVDTTTLRMVPESVALGSAPGALSDDQHPASQPRGQRQRRLSASSQPSTSPGDPSPSDPSLQTQHDKNKRKATTNTSNTANGAARSNSKDRRLAKKPRRLAASASSANGVVDPTLLTWVVSAGVLVLVSAISFSAGYVTGREAGMAEASVAGSAGGSLREGAARGCGREVGRGLRRLRWGAGTGSVRA